MQTDSLNYVIAHLLRKSLIHEESGGSLPFSEPNALNVQVDVARVEFLVGKYPFSWDVFIHPIADKETVEKWVEKVINKHDLSTR